MLILHVEDDMDIREIAKMAVELTGECSIVQSDCGEAALGIAEQTRPDVLLLDVMMPGMTGPQTLAKLREFEHLAEVPAIYMTARAQPSEVEALKETGAIGVIIKPFDPMTLAQQIRDFVAC